LCQPAYQGSRQQADYRITQAPPERRNILQLLTFHSLCYNNSLRQLLHHRIAHIQERIVAIPGFDTFVMQDLVPDTIETTVATFCELISPVLQGLLVHMMLAALARSGGRKQNQVRVPRDAVEQDVSLLCLQVLRNLKALSKIKLAS